MIRKKDLPNYINTQKGQSLVELALTITILVTLLAGAFDLGSAFLDYIALRDAAQEGALYASIGYDPSQMTKDEYKTNIRTRIRQSSKTPVDFSDPSIVPDDHIVIDFSGEPCKSQTVKITISYDYEVVMPGVGFFLTDQSIPLHASVTNVIITPLCP